MLDDAGILPPPPTGNGEKGFISQIFSKDISLYNVKLCIGYVLVKHLRFRTALSRFLTSNKAHVAFVLAITKHNKHLEKDLVL